MKRYLGLDLGSKTVGISISESGIIASTLTTIRFTEDKYEEACDKVIDIIQLHHIDVVVLGLPKHMNNDIGIRGKISESFKELLEKKTNVTIILWDERLSTRTAKQIMIQGSERRKNTKR